ncbi:ABC transporter substrate-binding protein [Burkholderia ubonensis]|uniref:ABC transporter substrate-binding protein n=1 Tax=Burkholderia ubonensis TaxID=101571 RepID=UPI000BA6E9AE|nr:ABC transporter substrate-binding protein [Burkholderia ubonensis]PAJ85345.1 ABC transporter substrate-binding protein [Burkholderia ubonensis]PAJ92291.1 ABC transporter substrate-binding protein [Burkholderia ubonensis]PAK05647.1 ABC transporter substrate-binding protein [Burkholderia ubonensis]PAK14477.1 ABC transporter substrate-binding protein [Burkholderia ubonensis]RQP67671.1 ABC transporter substrate-binding protein [Burkholderia ubonensis]
MAHIDHSIADLFTSAGKLRAAINLGNPILARRDPATGTPAGISVDLAHAFAQRLDSSLEMVVVESAGKSVDAVANGIADIGFFAIDPVRGKDIAFTAPYVVIEGFYLVRDSSSITQNDEVDRAAQRVVVGKGSAYDLFLTRELKHAQIVRAPTSPAVVDTFVSRNLDVAAGVKQQLEADARRTPGLRLLPNRFMEIHQAVGLPKHFGGEAALVLRTFVEEMKASGFVAARLAHHGMDPALAAPAEYENQIHQ